MPTTADRLPAGVLLAYGLPGLPLAALGLPLFILLPAFYSGEVGVSLSVVGFVLLGARLWDVVTDPLIGIASDRTRSPLGRRRPWMLAAVPPLMLAVWMLFQPPEGAGGLYLLGWSLILYLAWTMIQLPYAALGAELATSYHERTRVTAVREAAVVAGTLLAAGLPRLLGAEAPVGGGEGAGGLGEVLFVLAVILLVLLPTTTLLLSWRVAERPVPRPDTAIGFRAGARLLAANRPFRRLIAAYLLNGLANGLPATLFFFFVTHRLELPAQAGELLFVYFLCGIVGVPGWLAMSRARGKHGTWIVAMLANCVIFAAVVLLGPGDYWPFLAICVLSGLCLGADLVLPAAIQADVDDVDAAETGRRRTGLYFALWGMATKAALALAAVSLPVLEAAGFSARGANDETALLTLTLLYGIAPIGFKLAAIALMHRFPLGAAEHEVLRRRIEAHEADRIEN
jgi:glycoside/pentoside/hexuronide:cation symporter, GPH family